MDKIKSFEEFTLNEEGSALKFLGGILKGDIDIFSKPGEQDVDGDEGVSGDQGSSGDASSTYTPTGTYKPIAGNDDFTLYMQHQQGVAGAAGIVKALNGTGKMNPETIKTKGGVKYANLVKNIPSDRPQVKKDIIAALDKGDQKTAAALFLDVWKEKWFSKQAQAKTAINSSKNSVVKDAITKASAKYKVPFDFAITVANIESSLNPNAGNATYKGLFAMQPNSNYGGVTTPMGNKWNDPYVNAENGVKLLKNSITQLKKSLGNNWASLKVGSWANSLA
jgi:soluble lytic murein transglycosylase-like protein